MNKAYYTSICLILKPFILQLLNVRTISYTDKRKLLPSANHQVFRLFDDGTNSCDNTL